MVPTPASTPLQGHIVLVGDSDGTSNIYIMRADGTGQAPLVPPQGNAHDYALAISPDGIRLVFASGMGGMQGLYVYNLDSGEIQGLANSPAGS